jgi:hypothetical protein
MFKVHQRRMGPPHHLKTVTLPRPAASNLRALRLLRQLSLDSGVVTFSDGKTRAWGENPVTLFSSFRHPTVNPLSVQPSAPSCSSSVYVFCLDTLVAESPRIRPEASPGV